MARSKAKQDAVRENTIEEKRVMRKARNKRKSRGGKNGKLLRRKKLLKHVAWPKYQNSKHRHIETMQKCIKPSERMLKRYKYTQLYGAWGKS